MGAAVRIIGLVGMLLIGMAIGVNAAEKNMQEMQGLDGAARAIQITPKDGRIEIAVLGQNVQTMSPVPEADPEKVRQAVSKVRESGNVLATLLNHVGTVVRDSVRGISGWLIEWMMEDR
ncbi:DUF3679 domain-containing protein [Staphylospora marina]|uniref:DUF3679 domain-containing protein n=1 Tax=Staphylospora marina TaxID=2490858 RepID=UPI0013DDD657|nr:DUF3679 domain-containing protein [Staphylospora marina]